MEFSSRLFGMQKWCCLFYEYKYPMETHDHRKESMTNEQLDTFVQIC
jgi:hypothetical protein